MPMPSIQKIARYAHLFLQWQVRKATVLNYLPEEISIEVTNVCNFKCSFCPQSDPAHHERVPRSYLSTQNAEEILGKLRAAGVKTRVLHWTLDGEPFMNKQFPDLCSLALKWDFNNMYFATNGMLLNAETMDRLPCDLHTKYTFTIDFAADPVFFERVRGTPNSWQRICDNIQGILSDVALSHIRIELKDISTYEFSDRSEVKKRYADLGRLFYDPHRRLQIFHKTFHNATGLVEKLVPTSSARKYHLCPYPWSSLFVASSGDVVACCRDLRRQTVLGNLLVQTLPEIWNGAPFQELRRNLVDRHPERSAACDGCDLPYDDAKFSWSNMIRAMRGRFQVLD